MKFKKYIQYLLMVLSVPWALTAFIACTDDNIKIQAEVVIPNDVNLLELEQYSYAIPFEIKSDSEWEIDLDFGDGRDICYVYPESGTGNATVKICVLDNWTDDRREGNMYITFPQDESKNQTIKLRQKCNLDSDDNLTEVTVGDRIYAVGYGYNYLGDYASQRSVSRSPIVKMQEIIDKAKTNKELEGSFTFGGVDASFSVKTYSGSSVSSLMNDLSADAKFGGNYLGFKGEVGATFNKSDFKSNNHEYAITYVEIAQRTAYLEMSKDNIIEYMTKEAYNAINGLPTQRRGRMVTAYPSTAEGFQELVRDFGTHLIVKARLGGRLKYSMTVDISKVKGNYDLKAYANCSYSNKYVNTSAKVDDNLKSSYENNSEACSVELLVQGGDKTAATNVAKNGDIKNINSWEETLADTKNQVLVGLDTDTGLIPLYDLVDQSLTLDDGGVDGKARYNALKAYLMGDEAGLEAATANILGITMSYDTGQSVHIASIPTFDGSDRNNTLIKDINVDGQNVAQVCEEYIPVIDKTKRVTVIYPVISNVVKYNMGYFIGNDTHQPAKVCWDGTTLNITTYKDEPNGARTELYLRGSSFSSSSDDKTVKGTVSDYTMAAPGWNGSYNYPLVKIFNQIWMRKNYMASHDTHGIKIHTMDFTMDCEDRIYYRLDFASRSEFTPKGWRVSAKEDFLAIQKTLSDNNVINISTAKAFFPDADGGVLGFHHMNYGYFKDIEGAYVPLENGEWGYYGCLTNDSKNKSSVFAMGKAEQFGPMTYEWGVDYYAVRLVRDIE
jgi:uncharacterized protein (TIGR02145 family)